MRGGSKGAFQPFLKGVGVWEVVEFQWSTEIGREDRPLKVKDGLLSNMFSASGTCLAVTLTNCARTSETSKCSVRSSLKAAPVSLLDDGPIAEEKEVRSARCGL